MTLSVGVQVRTLNVMNTAHTFFRTLLSDVIFSLRDYTAEIPMRRKY